MASPEDFYRDNAPPFLAACNGREVSVWSGFTSAASTRVCRLPCDSEVSSPKFTKPAHHVTAKQGHATSQTSGVAQPILFTMHATRAYHLHACMRRGSITLPLHSVAHAGHAGLIQPFSIAYPFLHGYAQVTNLRWSHNGRVLIVSLGACSQLLGPSLCRLQACNHVNHSSMHVCSAIVMKKPSHAMC